MNNFGPFASPTYLGRTQLTRVQGTIPDRFHQPSTPQPSSLSQQNVFTFTDDSVRVYKGRTVTAQLATFDQRPVPPSVLQQPVSATAVESSDKLRVRVVSRSIERNSNFESLKLIKLDENKDRTNQVIKVDENRDRNGQTKQNSTFTPYLSVTPTVNSFHQASPQINFYESIRQQLASPTPRVVRIRTSVEHGPTRVLKQTFQETETQKPNDYSSLNSLTFRKHTKPPSVVDFKSFSSQTLEPPKSPLSVTQMYSENNHFEKQTNNERRSMFKKPILKKQQLRPKCDTSAPKTVKINETLNERHEFERYNFNGQRRMREGSYFDKLQREEEARIRQEIASFKAHGMV